MKKLNLIFASTLLTTTGLFAQNVNVTGAALTFQEFQSCLGSAMQGKPNEKAILECRETYLKAKGYIDKAAVDPSTENSPKMFFYKGQIYISSMYAYMTDTAYISANKETFEKNFEIGLESLKKAYQDKKFKTDVQDFVNSNVNQYKLGASMMYEKENFAEAGAAYELIYKFSDVLGNADAIWLFNAGASYQRGGKYEEAAAKFKQAAELGYKAGESYKYAIMNFMEAKKLDEIKALVEDAIKKYPKDVDVLTAGVNYYINVNDLESASQLLDKAAEQDPTNPAVFYNIGTITLGSGDFDKAEKSLKRAIELKPDYPEAYFQLGAVYVNKYGSLVKQMDNLKTNDPKYKELETASNEAIKNAVAPLEKYLEKNPNDKETLLNMVKIYRSLGNNEKAIEYKKRADAL